MSAGTCDRTATVVEFALPDGMAAGPWRLRDEQGAVNPLQVDDRHQAWFVLDALKAGAVRRYQLEAVPSVGPSAIELKHEAAATIVSAGGRELLRYQGDKGELPAGYAPEFQRGGYLSRIYTPTGRLVTDDYPPNHKHHHAVWFSWTKTEFQGRKPDFWNMGDKTGTVEFVALAGEWSGPVCAGLRARHRYLDLSAGIDPVVVLNETWEVVAYPPTPGAGTATVFDLTVSDQAATADPLGLPTYHYGGLGVRGNRQWDGAANAEFLTSEGKSRIDGNESRGRWCRLGGTVDGQPCGITILCHPGNFLAPQPMRLHPTEPFFCFAPSQLGPWAIAPGTPLVLRYRLIASDGPADAAEIERRWRDFADPPRVTIE